jgi:carbonic anhydrase
MHHGPSHARVAVLLLTCALALSSPKTGAAAESHGAHGAPSAPAAQAAHAAPAPAPAASAATAAPEAAKPAESAARAKGKAVAAKAESKAAAGTAHRNEAPHDEAPAAGSLDELRLRLASRLSARMEQPKPHAPREVKLVAKVGSASAARAPSRSRAAPHGEAAAASDAHGAGHAHWSYEGETGPSAWGRLRPDFALCGNGQRQSPIDIRDGLPLQLDELRFDYRPVGFKVQDNGHTVQVNLEPGNAVTAAGQRYELLQFHFHRPSEERIAGRQFEMSAHLVHRDAEGRLAVVALLLEAGDAHPVVQTVWNNLPLERGSEQAAFTQLNPADLLPPDRRYFTYMGSLTTPPCSEGVLWMVMQQPVRASAQQLRVFARLYPMNARPIQPLAGRRIKQSE